MPCRVTRMQPDDLGPVGRRIFHRARHQEKEVVRVAKGNDGSHRQVHGSARYRPHGQVHHSDTRGHGQGFAFVVLARVPFVAPDLQTAGEFYARMLIPHGGVLPDLALTVALVVLIAGQWTGWERLGRRLAPRRSARRWLAYGVALAVAAMLLPAGAPDFIYQQF